MIFQNLSRLKLTLTIVLCLSACKTGSEGGEVKAGGGISITITSPTRASSIDTTDATVSLAGTAASIVGVNKIEWNNDRGGQGVASGTVSWQIARIALQFGINEVTITAADNAGSRSSKSIAIYRESGQPGTATLFWNPPVSRTNGAPLANLSGYRILYGRMSGIYDYQINIENPGIVAYVVEDLMPGNWYFAMTAYDSQGLESTRSNEVFRNVL